ncbi:MAG: alternative ribosome rescue aminoacyl-tRNA hydrolase ArfB [Bdellovibrionota bacterium]|nr:alternative ribosome rescue aminoacyl-tRNA hydrolase ArfB [Bdellovibrionota bacterium]
MAKKVPKSELSFSFSKSSGAGGQNVNKLNTRVSLSWNITASKAIGQAAKERFIEKFSRMIVGDLVVIHSQKFRTQAKNIEDCITKLNESIDQIRKAPAVRRATKPTRSSIKKRLDSKSKKAKIKKLRSEKF